MKESLKWQMQELEEVQSGFQILVFVLARISQYALVGEYLEKLKKIKRPMEELTDEEQKKCEHAFQKLFGIGAFPFTVLQLSSGIDEEQVAEVFVRINSRSPLTKQILS